MPMPMKIRFDQAAPYEVEESDVPFARPAGKELQARVYRPTARRIRRSRHWSTKRRRRM